MRTSLLARLGAIAAGRFRDGSAAPPLEHEELDGELPLTFFQEARWPALAANPRDPYFLDGFALALRGALDVGALERALVTLGARHDALRLRVRLDRPAAVLAREGPREVPVEDVRDRPAEAQRRLALERMFAPLDVSAEALFRPRLLRTADDEHLLVFNYHNFLFNRRSSALILSEWQQLYAAYAAGQPSPLREQRLQFSDYMRWQRRWLTPDELERRLAPWRERLARCQPVRLETDRPRGLVPPPHRSDFRMFRIAEELPVQVLAFAKRLDATPFMTLFAAMMMLLQARTRAPEMTLRMITSDMLRATQSILGMFAGLGQVYVDFRDDPPLEVVVGRVRGAVLDALEDQQLPTWAVRPASFHDQFDVLVDAAFDAGPPTWPGLEARSVELPLSAAQTARFDFEWFFRLAADDQFFHFLYDAELFSVDTMDRLGREFGTVVGELVARPHLPVSSLRALL